MYADSEYLYMIRQGSLCALKKMTNNYRRLIWSRAYRYYHMHRPYGIEIDDLYQEASYSMYESFYKVEEFRFTGLAYFLDLCIVSGINTELRRGRGKAYRLLDTAFSLDMKVSEDSSLSLSDVVETSEFMADPVNAAAYYEAKNILDKVLESVLPLERQIYQLHNEGYSYKEISEFLDCGLKKVDNSLQKIRRLAKIHGMD